MGKQPWEPLPVPEGIPGLEPHDCSYRRRVEQLERENHILRLENNVLRNPDLKAVAPTLIELAKEVDEQAKRGHVDERGYVPVQAWKVANRAGVDRSTVSKHLKQASERGLVDKDVIRTRLSKPTVNKSTGEMRDYETEMRIRSEGPLVDTLIKLSTYTAPEHQRRKHGGARPRCYFHPNADIIRDIVDRCSECNRIVDRQTKIISDEPEAVTGTEH